jgi:hypothetical protein
MLALFQPATQVYLKQLRKSTILKMMCDQPSCGGE